jgi:hypothetical protein
MSVVWENNTLCDVGLLLLQDVLMKVFLGRLSTYKAKLELNVFQGLIECPGAYP